MGADPATMMMMVMQAAGTGIQMIGQQKEAKEQANTEIYNADILDQQAGLINQSSQYNVQRLRNEKERTLSTMRSKYANAGVLLEGSPLEVMADTATEYEMDINAETFNANTRKRLVQNEANYKREKANKILKQGFFDSLITGFMGASNIVMTGMQSMPKKQTVTEYKGL